VAAVAAAVTIKVRERQAACMVQAVVQAVSLLGVHPMAQRELKA
jgi:hypothetical protein